jgi:hypothetical protein
VPGLGQVVLGRRRRGAAFAAIVVITFAIGFLLGGTLPRPAAEEPLSWLGTAAVGATGMLGASAWSLGLGRSGPGATNEAGTAFLLTAGIMSLLLLFDALERRRGE